MRFAQGHSAVTSVRLEPATPRSQVKHSTTESLRSLLIQDMLIVLNFLMIFSPWSSQKSALIN